MDNTIKFLVDKRNSGKRLDIFLAENTKKFTRSFLKKLIEGKKVKLNSDFISTPSLKVKYKDQILIYIIEKKILENKDIFNRGFKLKQIELDESYPNYILDNKKKLHKWIL